MGNELKILYRGPLSSCNYGCPYCPFAKRHETAKELKRDAACLSRFAEWVRQSSERDLGILITPWGEALTRRWYRDTMVELSHLSHVSRIAVQTNLSIAPDWLDTANRDSIALWCTYHPGEVDRDKFLANCHRMDRLGIRYSVGVVGLKEHADEIESLRRELDPGTYLWINAYKRESQYYSDQLIEQFTGIDKLFPVNNQYHHSKGKHCNTGHTVISVAGDGAIRRCHFVDEVLGNLYEDNLDSVLSPRLCTNETCGCHIGYVHMPHLGMNEVFGEGLLERIPEPSGRA